ncbi:unnamed protein product [Rotaria magnacalcarata]|uniref:Granulins domain-containing protein n=1 Tax=Rotaria magnacalcarata TaxID=392030 RepID=A0A816NFY3_9BILA|nr:unnamed protein product [Rotaria magnacalcarata]CAF3909753.1 unnamed protein product [Rotaria magnacalcarata]
MWFIKLILFVGILNKYSNGFYNNFKYSLDSISIKTKSIPCPDKQSYCPDNETCCLLSSGQYGCCPLPDAVCCNDNLHCCPNGYTCDVEHSRCQKGFENSYDILCPDHEMSCSDGETCCQLQSGEYGCCPLPNAVCCNDYNHCCPNGYICNIKENKCDKGISIPWFRKKSAFPLKNILSSKIIIRNLSLSLSTIQCSDEKSICPEETTCCELNDHSYGCCPYRQASCCSDKIHCCQKGYSCDESGSRCIRHLNFIEKQNIKSQTLISLSIVQEQICPDEKTICSLNSTCCPNKNEQIISYSCCPYSNGTCCGSNGSFCCPYKYICDEKQLTCQLNKTIHIDNQFLNKCGSSNFVCQFNQTCCKTSQSTYDQYACCDFPHAVCCDDGQHCCPMGTFCDNKSCGCITS